MLLLLSSIVFYLLSGPKYIVFLFITSIATYLLARRIQSLHDREKQEADALQGDREGKKLLKKKYTKKRKRWLLLGLFIALGLLAVMKYTNFALSGVSAVLARFGVDWSREFNLILPLGISFYTFMAVGYLLDVYWKRYQAEKNFFHYFLFAIYFPHILQGPIGRYNKLAPQLRQSHAFEYDRVAKGIQLMLWGYFEKLVIADRLAIFANGVYAKWETLSGLPLILAIFFFSIQIYLDFQGYMDIGRGISQVFGIELEVNFNHPYFSKTMPEFWRRWHITLGAWFKDYLLYPVSMSGISKTINRWTRKHWGNDLSRTCSTILPAACVWLATGIWHGAASCYVFWGIYHGILVIAGTVFERPMQRLNRFLHINTEAWSFHLFQMARTFVLSAVGRIFFVSSEGFFRTLEIIKKTFDFRHLRLYTIWDESLFSYGLDRHNFLLSWILIALLWVVSMLQERMCIRDVIAKENLVFRWILYISLIVGILILGIYGSGYDASAFVYGQF